MSLRAGTTGIIVHHTVTNLDVSIADLRRMHVSGNGWRDIGYNSVVHRVNGEWVHSPGRDGHWRAHGAHAGPGNSYNHGIAVVGNYTDQEEEGAAPLGREPWQTMPEMWAVLVRSVATLCLAYGVEADTITPHSHWMNTACCGFSVDPLRSDVARLLRLVDRRAKLHRHTENRRRFRSQRT